MKLWLYGFAMCQSMFCAIPFPFHGWEEKARDRMLLCLPFVGLEIGLIWYGLSWAARFLNLPPMMTAVITALFPFLATGQIHLDGFMDVTDAVRSYRNLERRREILKDSHVGSFAVIAVAMLLISQFAFCCSLPDIRLLILIPVVSRCCSILSVVILPPMETSQYANREKKVSSIVLLAVTLVMALAAGFLLTGKYAAALLGGVAGYGLALRHAYKSLQGMNGDIAGYALTFSELAALAVLSVL